MDATPTLNAKQRRKLLRKQQQQQEDASAVPEVKTAIVKEGIQPVAEPMKQELKAQESTAPAAVTPAESGQLNTKERRRLARLAKQKAEAETEGDASSEVAANAATDVTSTGDDEKLNSQQRRLLKRQAKRKVEGVDEKKPMQKKQKKRKTEQEGEDGKPVNVKSIHLTLFVGQLPYRATEAMVRKHFAEAGDIKLRMLTDKKTKRFKGTAFIEVKDSKALGAALSRHHTLLQGRRINVELTASGGGNKSENRRNKIDLLRKKQSNVQVEKTKALIQKHINGHEYKLQKDDVDDRMIDFLSWFDYETAKKALDEYNRCVSERVNNRKAFFMGILKRFRQTDGIE